MWAGRDLRQRWLSLALLGVIAGLSAALAMSSIAGARRADTAFDRLSTQTRAADAIVFSSQVEGGIYTKEWAELARLPYVKAVAPWNLVFGAAGDEDVLLFMPSDGRWFNTVDQPVVLEGRMWDPKAPGELLISEIGAKEFGLHVGDRVPFRTFTQNKITVGRPTGPEFPITVVGIVRETNQYLFTPMVMLSPGTLQRHPKMGHIENGHVRLRDAERDMPALRRDVQRVLPKGTPVLDLHSVQRRVGTTISIEAIAQLLLGVAVVVAGLVFVGQALTRSVGRIDDDSVALRAIGFTRLERARAAALPHTVTVVVAALVAVGTTWLMSSRFPVGYARTVDPNVGHHLDWTVVLPGLALLVLVLGAGTFAIAWSRAGRLGGRSLARSNRLATLLRRHAPLPVGLGSTMALESGAGRRTVPVGPALLGAVAGVLGIVGTLSIDHGLRDAVSHPERAGVTWDSTVVPANDDYRDDRSDAVTESFTRVIASRPGLASAAIVGRQVMDVDGVGVPIFDVKPVRGDLALVVTEGREPASSDEITLGPATARQLGVEVGDTVTVSPDRRAESQKPLRAQVVGLSLFPHEVHSGFTEGGWLAEGVMPRMTAPTNVSEGTGVEQFAALVWKPGVDADRSVAAMQRDFGSSGRMAAPAELPPELTNLDGVLTLPRILVVFLVLLAIAALAHVLVTTIRYRRTEFAILRALGFTKPNTALVVAAHSTTVGLVGLVIGIPIGVIVGRLGWAWVAHKVPLVFVEPVAIEAVLLIIPVALIIANVVGAIPGQRAARLKPAAVLRTE